MDAIQTAYAGCLFRSRLEARWAIVFDALRLRWRYEPEGFALSDGRGYLPDFFIEGIGWIEIKPNEYSDNGKWQQWCEENVDQEDFRAFLVCGDIPNPDIEDYVDVLRYVSVTAFVGGMTGGFDTEWMLCTCPYCDVISISWHGVGPCNAALRNDGCLCRSHRFTGGSARIIVAYIAGRSARFEACVPNSPG